MNSYELTEFPSASLLISSFDSVAVKEEIDDYYHHANEQSFAGFHTCCIKHFSGRKTVKEV